MRTKLIKFRNELITTPRDKPLTYEERKRKEELEKSKLEGLFDLEIQTVFPKRRRRETNFRGIKKKES